MLKPYMDLIFTDAIVRNGDRHEFNYGFITDKKGAIKLALNFDNNIALFSRGVPRSLKRGDILVADFIEILPTVEYQIPNQTAEMISEAYSQTTKMVETQVQPETVISFCMNAYDQICAV
ncbi:MAG: hypothetical protein LBI27_00870 [Clostridiales bacterium]|nr:hypothetical protein [Clostridiales bacterium]